MSFFSKKETKSFIYGYFRLNFKKGTLEKLEVKTLKISYHLWRKTEISFPLCLKKILKSSCSFILFKKVKFRGVFAKIPFFVQNEKRSSAVINWIRSNFGKTRFFFSLESFFFENLKREGQLKARKKIIHEVANQYKVFAFKRWF